MSVYQNSYFIVPRKGNYTLFEGLNLNSFFEDDLFEDDLLWEDLNYKYVEYEDYLNSVFKLGESWSSQLKMFGNNDTNCLKVLIENEIIVSVSFRVNFEINYIDFLKEIIEFCKLNDWLIVDNELNTLSIDFETINDNITESKAYKNYINFFKK